MLTASCMTGILLLLKISAFVSFTISKMNHKKFIFILNRKIYTLSVLPQGYVKHPQLFLDIIQRYLDHLDIHKNITLIYYIIVTMLTSKMVKRCLTLEYLVWYFKSVGNKSYKNVKFIQLSTFLMTHHSGKTSTSPPK